MPMKFVSSSRSSKPNSELNLDRRGCLLIERLGCTICRYTWRRALKNRIVNSIMFVLAFLAIAVSGSTYAQKAPPADAASTQAKIESLQHELEQLLLEQDRRKSTGMPADVKN